MEKIVTYELEQDKKMKNLFEPSKNIVHAEFPGNDYTLCGVTAEKVLNDISEYDPMDEDSEIVPCMLYTKKKIDCPTCATIIKYCCKLGLKSLDNKKVLKSDI